MLRIVSWIAAGALLFLVPFGSWYYLKSGLEYRKNQIRELVVKDSLLSTEVENLVHLKGKTTLFVNDSSPNKDKVIEGIRKQFEKTANFQIIVFTNASSSADSLSFYPHYINKNPQSSYFLLDTAAALRNYYGYTDSEIKKLIEHIASVIPKQKDADINFKNNQQ